MADVTEVINRFTFHPANEFTGPLHDKIRENYRGMAEVLLQLVPEGRHQSLALSALQESMMWANAGVACDFVPPVGAVGYFGSTDQPVEDIAPRI